MISVIGCGPGGADYVTPAARRAVQQADVVLGSPRLLAMFDLGDRRRVELPPRSTAALKLIEQQLTFGKVAVLVSGDPNLFSLTKSVINHFGRQRCLVVPGISSVQVAFARLGLESSGVRVISAHGQVPRLGADELGDENTFAVLAGTSDSMEWAAELARQLTRSHKVYVCENLTLTGERIYQALSDQLKNENTSSLTVLIFTRSDRS